MEEIRKLLEVIRSRLTSVPLKDSVASKPLSVENRHVLVLSEITVGFGVGGGTGEEAGDRGQTKGTGGGGGGLTKASPVAVLVVEQGKVRLDKIGN